MGCTNLVAVPPATKDDEIYLLWNVDVVRTVRPITKRFRFFVSGGEIYSYVAWGLPGKGYIGLMNEEGLSFVGNAVGVSDGGDGEESMLELLENCLSKCKTVDEVAEMYKNSDRLVIPGHTAAIFANFNSMWADLNGDAVTIEYSKNHVEVHEIGEEGVMVETNHHQYLNRNLSGSSDPESQKQISGSYARLSRAWELARKYAGDFDLETIKKFASDHQLNYDLLKDFDFEIPESGIVDDSTICCHLWNVPNYIRKLELVRAAEAAVEGETLYSLILQPKQKQIWFCPGKPCSNSYTPINLETAFNSPKDHPKIEQSLVQGKSKKIFSWFISTLDKMLPAE